MRTAMGITILSTRFFLIDCMYDVPSEIDRMPVLQICNKSNQPIWIGLTNGENLIYKGKLEACTIPDHPECYSIYRYDKEKNPLGINVKKMTGIFIWLKNPENRRCINPHFTVPLVEAIKDTVISIIWNGETSEHGPLDFFYTDESGFFAKITKWKEATS